MDRRSKKIGEYRCLRRRKQARLRVGGSGRGKPPRRAIHHATGKGFIPSLASPRKRKRMEKDLDIVSKMR